MNSDRGHCHSLNSTCDIGAPRQGPLQVTCGPTQRLTPEMSLRAPGRLIYLSVYVIKAVANQYTGRAVRVGAWGIYAAAIYNTVNYSMIT